jgi:putative redox protein
VSDRGRRGKPPAAVAAAPEDIVVNRARGRMLTRTATELRVRDLAPLTSDEPPARGGENRGPSPLELVLFSLCACTNVTTGRMAAKLRFRYSNLETEAEGELDTRGRKGTADVPVHYRAVRLRARIDTEESDERIERLADLVGRYCPVDSLIGAAVDHYTVDWERM